MSDATLFVYLFEEGKSTLRGLLGGKGADLAEMTKLGLPVPPGMIVTTEARNLYNAKNATFPDGMWEEVLAKLKVLESKAGKGFGDASNPFLVSVRSGAPISMPGMMDTILNLGLNDKTVDGLRKQTANERFVFDSYRRLIQMFGRVVMGLAGEEFEAVIQKHKDRLQVKQDIQLDAPTLRIIASEFKQIISRETSRGFPQDPYEQLRMAIKAVFDSWNGRRAKIYRSANRIPDTLGTAVNIQTMVFGNTGPGSGTGVCFTRNPSTGGRELYGEFLLNAQGEDVVAGVRTPEPIAQLQGEMPQVHEQLLDICQKLEKHFRDMQDIEFTVENGRLFILQTRSGKRTASATIKIAADMVEEGLISKEEALSRVQPSHIEQLLHEQVDPKGKVKPISTGLPASPGAAHGKVIFDTDEAHKLGSTGHEVILVRPETTPEDIHGMIAARGVLTSRGGITSHAAVVARGMGKPAVVGCESIRIDLEAEQFVAGGLVVKKGDVITIDGTTGNVMFGEVPTIQPELSGEAKQILSWADTLRTMRVRANADTPDGAAKALQFGAEGIGLCRTERMFNAKDRLPVVQEMILAATDEERSRALAKLLPLQKEDFKAIFRIMHNRPVTIRLLDLPLHEFLPKLEELEKEVALLETKDPTSKELAHKRVLLKKVLPLAEHNPMLGHRGCRLAVSHPEIYEMQVRAIFEAAAELAKEGVKAVVEIMLPLVGEVNEVRFLKERIQAVVSRVIESVDVELSYSLGTMIEVPRAAITADEIATEVDFFSFGTNDLTQTTFAYSRDDAEGKFLKDYFDHKILASNPFEVLDRNGVGKLMRIAVEAGRKSNAGLKLGICGEHGGEPSSVEFCYELGLDYVSCSPYRVPVARLVAAQAVTRKRAKVSAATNI